MLMTAINHEIHRDTSTFSVSWSFCDKKHEARAFLSVRTPIFPGVEYPRVDGGFRIGD
jgi:hypothetical protein